MSDYKQLLKEIESLDADLFQRDFLLTWNKSEDELRRVLYTAEFLKYLHQENISARCFDSGLAVSIFRDQSTRTRFSFASAANLLGLQAQDLDEGKSQIAHGETVRETANMISFLTETIGIRDDIFLGKGHAYMKEVSDAVQDGYETGVLHQRPSVINLQCDMDHPTQSLMDDAFGDADVVYPKSWAPYDVMERRTALLEKNDQAGLESLEKECLARNAHFMDWECTEEKMKLTREGKALYMHCLPADITHVSCEAGEVQKSVFEKYRIDTYKEAGYKPFIIAAMIVNSRFADPAALLYDLKERNQQRIRSF